jgi:hypothetical protein
VTKLAALQLQATVLQEAARGAHPHLAKIAFRNAEKLFGIEA